MRAPALDRDRLVADLRRAADAAEGIPWNTGPRWWDQGRAMARAWRIVVAAIVDGEYDEEPTRARGGGQPWRSV